MVTIEREQLDECIEDLKDYRSLVFSVLKTQCHWSGITDELQVSMESVEYGIKLAYASNGCPYCCAAAIAETAGLDWSGMIQH